MSKTEIHKLLETKRFDAETITPLEKYVSSESYDFEADHALLKLYQFYPSRINKTVIATVLVRALAQLPSCDFIQHLYLLSETVQTSDEPIANIVAAHDLLERAHFADFWIRATGPLFESADIKKGIRTFITDIISKSYKVIRTTQYSELLNLKDAELAAEIKHLESLGWTQADGSLHIPSDLNTSKPKPTSEVLQFEQFGKILAPLR